MKLRTRLIAVLTSLTAITLALAFIPLYLLVHAAETRDLDNALFRHASALAQHLPDAYRAGHPLDEGHADVPESLDPTVRYVAVYGDDRQLESASDSFDGLAPARLGLLGLRGEVPWDGVTLDLRVGDTNLRGVAMPIGDEGKTLLYAVSKSTVEDDASHLLQLLSLLFVAAAASAALVARLLGDGLSRDVHEVARVARAVAGGDLAARIGDPRTMGADETRALASDLDTMISRLDELVTSQRRFVTHAAHELRSPLASLRGELQLALRREREPAEYRAALAEMLSSVDALIALAEDLLRLARVQSEAQGAHDAAPADVVSEALRMARGPAEAREVPLVVVPEPLGELPRVRGAANDLARALRNLIDNAVTHSPRGQPVQIEVAAREGGVEIAVVDHGAGVRPDDAPHIFTPLFRGAGGPPHGVGLGLAIARGIAEASGGRLTLDATHVGGARFVLTLAPAPPIRAH